MNKIFAVLLIPLMFLGCGGGGGETASPTSLSIEKWAIVSTIPLTSTPSQIVVSNGMLYIASYDFTIVDVSNPTAPVAVHTIAANTGTLGNIYGVSVSGSKVIVAATLYCSGSCLADPFAGVVALYDMTNPSNPVKISEASLAAGDVLLDGSTAYVSLNELQPKLQVIDMSVQPTATIIGSTDVATAGRLAKSGNYIYLSYNNGSSFEALQTIDITNLPNPVTLNAGNNAWFNVTHAHIALSGNTAFIADETQGLRVLDVSDPANPSTILTIPAQSSVSDIAVYDGYLYVCDGSAVRVFDISSPHSPVPSRTITTAYPAKLVAVKDGIGVVVMEKTYHTLYYVGVFVPGAH